MSLSPEQQQVVDLVLAGRNVFFTGPAGTGKSYVMNVLRERLLAARKHATFTACTGAAAVLIEGSTIHSFAGVIDNNVWDPTLSPEDAFQLVRKNKGMLCKACDKWSKTDVLFIDEISMFDSTALDKLEYFARRYRRRMNEPWGGIQLVLSGDLLQLPPVQFTAFAFASRAWQLMDPSIIVLQRVFRQDGDDSFLSLLHHVRVGNATPEVVDLLASIEEPGGGGGRDSEEEEIIPTNLYAYNASVDKLNSDQLRKLNEETGNPIYTYAAEDSGPSQNLLNNLQAAARVYLCKGAQVMLLCNLNVAGGLANGSRGVVTHIDPDTHVPHVKFKNGTVMAISPHTWTFEDNSQPGKKKPPKAKRIQIPLRLAWAIAVHKSQGMTLDSVRIDCTGFRNDGQFYVALSRARALENVRLMNFTPDCIRASPSAVAFFTRLVSNDVCVGSS